MNFLKGWIASSSFQVIWPTLVPPNPGLRQILWLNCYVRLLGIEDHYLVRVPKVNMTILTTLLTCCTSTHSNATYFINAHLMLLGDIRSFAAWRERTERKRKNNAKWRQNAIVYHMFTIIMVYLIPRMVYQLQKSKCENSSLSLLHDCVNSHWFKEV